MYDWLHDALDDTSCLVTANRRLARELQSAWGESQLERGATAWRTPDVLSWQRWIASLVEDADEQANMPTRINAQQSQLIWERCLRKEPDLRVQSASELARELQELGPAASRGPASRHGP